MKQIGFIAGLLTTFSFLPQLVKTWQLKETKDISLLYLLMLSAGLVLWIVYGFFIDDMPLIFANSITLTFALIIIGFKIKYK